jgi:hypothetical protein
MAKLSQAQIEVYAQAAGMSNPKLMAAIAMAESKGGDPRAHNPIPPDNSYGLWQINMIGKLGPARRKQFGLKSNEDLYDPAINARVAAAILKSQGLSAWSTYTSGAYEKYYGGKADDSGTVQQADLKDVPVLGDVLGAGETAAQALSLFARGAAWVSNPHNWLNVIYVGAGGGIILMALSATVRNNVYSQIKSLPKKVTA